VQPFSGGALSVHFENNGPFAEAVSLVREIEVSHWGNVYVEEYYDIKHTGALLKVGILSLFTAMIVAGLLSYIPA